MRSLFDNQFELEDRSKAVSGYRIMLQSKKGVPCTIICQSYTLTFPKNILILFIATLHGTMEGKCNLTNPPLRVSIRDGKEIFL